MAASEIDAYLQSVDQPKRTNLEHLRSTILELLPDAEECISYSMPAFKIKGTVVAGFAAFKSHLSYFPHSGSVIPQLPGDTAGYSTTNATLRFAIDTPLPRELVEKLVAVRLAQAFPKAAADE